MRTLLFRALFGGFLSPLILVPIFVSAQTGTTTAEQATSSPSVLQSQIDQLIQSRANLLPKIEDVRVNSIRNLLDVQISPNNPGPNELISIRVESYLSDMNKALIIWSLNDRVVSRGVGKTSFSFQNGASGKTTRLTIAITTNTGDSFTKEYSWTPVGVTLFWEADTYTPPFYRGKALLSPQARVKVIATPDNTGTANALGAGNLVYVWEKDGSTISDVSGYGKNSFTFDGPKPYDETNVKVHVSSVDDTMNSEARVFLSLSDPFILFYDKNPLQGVLYNHPFGTALNLTAKEFSISAEPYFFSNERSDTPTLQYGWTVNGSTVQNPGRSITLRNETGAKGSSVVSLAMHGIKQSFQSASRDLRVNFSESAPTNRPTF